MSRETRFYRFTRHLVRHVWLVDPLIKTLEMLELTSAQWQLIATHQGDVNIRAAPFDAVELDLSALWSR